MGSSNEILDLRFTVTVHGNYLHFEDMMIANCCADALYLEMVENNHIITIYEHEYLSWYPCPCLCNYPITATLGPFEPGTYLIEVYNIRTYIGATVVEIP